jgi:ABC-type antimicrobial peptide transport system permease subunit
VFLLSTRLRAREIDTMLKIGASKWRIRAILSTEIAGVLIAGLCLAWALVWMTAQYGPQIVRSVFLQ